LHKARKSFKKPGCVLYGMSGTGKELGMLFLGLGIGSIIPSLPQPLTIIQPYLWVVFFVIAFVLFFKA
jgi:hypothetical protein